MFAIITGTLLEETAAALHVKELRGCLEENKNMFQRKYKGLLPKNEITPNERTKCKTSGTFALSYKDGRTIASPTRLQHNCWEDVYFVSLENKSARYTEAMDDPVSLSNLRRCIWGLLALYNVCK